MTKPKNAFEELGYSAESAANLMVRSELMTKINNEIKRLKLKQKEAAKLLGVTQPRISDLARGHIHLFTVDMLVNMLTALDMVVTVSAKHRKKTAA